MYVSEWFSVCSRKSPGTLEKTPSPIPGAGLSEEPRTLVFFIKDSWVTLLCPVSKAVFTSFFHWLSLAKMFHVFSAILKLERKKNTLGDHLVKFVLLRLRSAQISQSSGDLVKRQISSRKVSGKFWGCLFLTSSQMTPRWLVWGPDVEQQGSSSSVAITNEEAETHRYCGFLTAVELAKGQTRVRTCIMTSGPGLSQSRNQMEIALIPLK